MRCGEYKVDARVPCDHKGPHHTVPQAASQYRCALRKRFVCYQRPHTAWRSKLNNIL